MALKHWWEIWGAEANDGKDVCITSIPELPNNKPLAEKVANEILGDLAEDGYFHLRMKRVDRQQWQPSDESVKAERDRVVAIIDAVKQRMASSSTSPVSIIDPVANALNEVERLVLQA